MISQLPLNMFVNRWSCISILKSHVVQIELNFREEKKKQVPLFFVTCSCLRVALDATKSSLPLQVLMKPATSSSLHRLFFFSWPLDVHAKILLAFFFFFFLQEHFIICLYIFADLIGSWDGISESYIDSEI